MAPAEIEAAAREFAERADRYADDAFNAQHALRQQELAAASRIEAEGRERALHAQRDSDEATDEATERGLPVGRRPARTVTADLGDIADDSADDNDDGRTWLR